MKRTKFWVLALLITLIAGIFSACGAGDTVGNDTTTPAVSSGQSDTPAAEPAASDPFKDPMEISIAFWQIGDYFPQGIEDKAYDQIKNDLNITVKPVIVTWSDYGEKYKIWAATNELPDVMAHDGLGMKDTWKWQSQGVIRAFPVDMSPYPELKKFFDDERADVFYRDGKYWAVPRYQFADEKYQYSNVILMHKGIYDSLGLAKAPETMDELAAMLKSVKEKYPDKVPLTTHSVGKMFSLMDNYNPYSEAWILENGKWIPGFFSEKTVEGLKAMKPLWDEGLLDRDFAINKNTFNGRDKFINGTAAAIIYTIFPGHWATTYAVDWNKKYPGTKLEDMIVVLNPPKNPDGNYYMGKNLFWSETYIGANVDDKKMDRICRLFDYLLSEKGTNLRRYGIEGIDYVKNGNKIEITREKNENGVFNNLQEIYKSEGLWQSLVTWDEDFPFVDPSVDPSLQKLANDWLDWKQQNEKTPPNYNVMINTISTPLKDKFAYNINSDDLVRLLLSDDLEAEWKAMMGKYEKEGLSQMVDEVNNAAKEVGLIP